MPLYHVANHVARLPVAAAHAPGSGTLVLAVAADGLPAAPFRPTAVAAGGHGPPGEARTIFGVSAVSDGVPAAGQCTLTVAPIEGTTDLAFAAGDLVDLRITAGAVADLNGAVEALDAEIEGLDFIPGPIPGSPGQVMAG